MWIGVKRAEIDECMTLPKESANQRTAGRLNVKTQQLENCDRRDCSALPPPVVVNVCLVEEEIPVAALPAG